MFSFKPHDFIFEHNVHSNTHLILTKPSVLLTCWWQKVHYIGVVFRRGEQAYTMNMWPISLQVQHIGNECSFPSSVSTLKTNG
jgi:hypothetical protein